MSLVKTQADKGTTLAAFVDEHTDRFAYQRAAVTIALQTWQGLVLNVGCKEDPAWLKAIQPGRVINCDLVDHDEYGEPTAADRLFDAAQDEWPFDRHEASMVVIGDMLEHLDQPEAMWALRQARRVSNALCLTVPMDTKVDLTYADLYPRGARHRTCFTNQSLRISAQAAGWHICHFRTVDYVFLPVGFLMCCV